MTLSSGASCAAVDQHLGQDGVHRRVLGRPRLDHALVGEGGPFAALRG